MVYAFVFTGVCVVARDTDPEFDCADDGSFEPLQCRAVGDVFVCHCVQPSSGDIIPGTEVSVADLADAPDCDSLGEYSPAVYHYIIVIVDSF